MSDDIKKPDDFENPNVGEQFGGSYPRLDLKVDEASGMLSYTGKDTEIEVEDLQDKTKKKTLKIQVFLDLKSEQLCTAPIGAIWDSVWAEANIKVGDEFRVKRYADVPKKGTGQNMKVYAIKVYSRAK